MGEQLKREGMDCDQVYIFLLLLAVSEETRDHLHILEKEIE
jgi:hypothetical protein